MAENGTIDLTNVVEAMRSTFAKWASDTLFSASVAYLPFLGLPVISTVYKWFLDRIVGALASAAVMEAFFLNTVVRKASQAAEYVDAVNAKNMAKTDEEYEVLELKEISAFNRFVVLVN